MKTTLTLTARQVELLALAVGHEHSQYLCYSRDAETTAELEKLCDYLRDEQARLQWLASRGQEAK